MTAISSSRRVSMTIKFIQNKVNSTMMSGQIIFLPFVEKGKKFWNESKVLKIIWFKTFARVSQFTKEMFASLTQVLYYNGILIFPLWVLILEYHRCSTLLTEQLRLFLTNGSNSFFLTFAMRQELRTSQSKFLKGHLTENWKWLTFWCNFNYHVNI